MFRSQCFGRDQQLSLLDVRLFLPLALEEPIGEKLEFEVFHAVVVEDPPHLLEASALEHVGQVGMPQSQALKAGLRRSRNPIPEVEGTVLPVGMRQSASGN